VSAQEHNLAAVRPLLDGSPFAVRAAEGSEVLAAVDLDLVTPGGVVRVRLSPNVASEPAFARSASLSVSHLASAGDPPLPHAAIHALRAFARHVASRDRGGIALIAPAPRGTGAHEGGARRLPMMGAGTSEASWSRALFDRRIAAFSGDRGAFSTAILVVVQPCEMSCRFCPSGDRARAVPPDLSLDAHFEDLLHQLAAARSLGVRTVEIGGNDVLLFPRAIELFHAAGRLGFERISAQSPGQRLADEGFSAAAAESPLGRVDLPIYGATAEAHEGVTRAPGSFEGLCRAIDRALALGRPEVRLHTIALRSTLDRLDELIAFGERRFGLTVRVQMLRPNRVGEREHLEDAASLAEIAEAARRHPASFGDDVPLCALPPERANELFRERTAERGFGRRLHLWDLGLGDGSEDARVKEERAQIYPAACGACALRRGCTGVLRAYVDRFGEADLKPF
jgi:MoaA/NifB/PqqE/SkfB family radical SAM enzyme